MAKLWMVLLVGAFLAPACRTKRQMDVDTSQAQDIPRELAIEKLKQAIPTAYYFGLTDPKYRWRLVNIDKWIIDAKGFEAHPYNVQAYRLDYASILSTRLNQVGSKYTVTLVTRAGSEETPEAAAFFTWRNDPDAARRALELFEALRGKQ